MTVRIDFEILFPFENIRSSFIPFPSLRAKTHHCDARLERLDIRYQSISLDSVLNVRHIVSGTLLVDIANVAENGFVGIHHVPYRRQLCGRVFALLYGEKLFTRSEE